MLPPNISPHLLHVLLTMSSVHFPLAEVCSATSINRFSNNDFINTRCFYNLLHCHDQSSVDSNHCFVCNKAYLHRTASVIVLQATTVSQLFRYYCAKCVSKLKSASDTLPLRDDTMD